MIGHNEEAAKIMITANAFPRMYAPVETISYRESIVTRINWQEKKCPDRRISDVSLCALIGREIPFGQKNFHVSGERRFSLFLKIQLAFDCTRATLGAWG